MIVDVVLLYVVWCAALFFLQDWMIFPTDSTPTPLPVVPYEEAEVVRLDIERGEHVEALFLPAPACGDERPAPVVVFFHGNAELIDYQDPIVEGYRRLGCSVLLPEYRGYGRCGGKPSQERIRSDMIRFYDALLERGDVDASRSVFHGRSLGGSVAADLAVRRKPTALILESTLSSLVRMSRRYLVPPFLVRHPYRTDRVVAALDIPVLIFHGARDDVIPVAHGQRLRDAAKNATYVEYDCAHNDFPGHDNEVSYWNEVEAFLSGCGVISTSSEQGAAAGRTGQRGRGGERLGNPPAASVATWVLEYESQTDETGIGPRAAIGGTHRIKQH